MNSILLTNGLTIGQAARASGVSAKMIRHYEKIGLIPKPHRTYSGYRTYGEKEIHIFRFIKQSRNLGFSMKQTAELLGLWQDRKRPSGKVKKLALDHIHELDERIQEMQAMKETLEHLAQYCRGDERPDCPILNQLASTNSIVGLNSCNVQPAQRRSKKKIKNV